MFARSSISEASKLTVHSIEVWVSGRAVPVQYRRIGRIRLRLRGKMRDMVLYYRQRRGKK
jgi:hypothetical protein